MEICKEIKANNETKHIPVILMLASEKTLLNYEECNAPDILSKPFHLPELLDKIKSALLSKIGNR